MSTGSAGIVTFAQLDVNFAENNATIVKTGASAATIPANTFLDGLTIPSTGQNAGKVTFSYDYESNDQRNRSPGSSSVASDAPIRVVAVGLGTGQYAFAQAEITRNKGQAVSVTGALERVYSDPA